MVDEGKESHEAMLPDEEDVVYEPFPQEGKEVLCVDVGLFKSTHVGDGIVGSGSGAQGGITYLEEVLATEGEIVAFEHELQEFDKGGIGGMLGPRSDGFQSFEGCLYTFGIGDVSVVAADV